MMRDTLLITSGSTSSCVRATMVEEDTFDRIQLSHKTNVLDMNIKYADVMKAEAIGRYLDGRPAGLYD